MPYSELYHLTKNSVPFLNYLSGVVRYIIAISCTFCFLPGCGCIFSLDFSGSQNFWLFLYLANSQVCRWVHSHRSGPHVQNVDVSNTEGRRFSWLPWHPTHHYSPGNWSQESRPWKMKNRWKSCLKSSFIYGTCSQVSNHSSQKKSAPQYPPIEDIDWWAHPNDNSHDLVPTT